MKAHLLFRDADFDLAGELPSHADDLVRDLELGILIGAMAGRDEFLADVAFRVLMAGLTDPDAILYRQAILQDFLDHPHILRELYGEVVQTLTERKRMWGYSWSFRNPRTVLSRARECVELFLRHLRALRSLAEKYRLAVTSEGLVALFDSLQEDLSDDYLDAVARQLKRLQFPDGLLLSAQLARDNSGERYVLRVPERERPGWKQRLGMAPRTVYSFNVHPRDEAGTHALDDLWSRGLNEVANALAQSADHIGDYFAMLRVELGFYLGCLNLVARVAERGQPICMPEVAPAGAAALSFRELRDICLVLQSQQPVVGNDADADGKSLLVVTGANSGGKSTFLRSVGVAQLLAQAGMFVSGRFYRTSVVPGVVTHFVREEDVTMSRGRLEEELSRLRDLVRELRPGSLVLFNESFHSTNEREGSEIARQIVRALRDAGNRVAFVTHQYDFAQSFLGEDGTTALFLRAQLGPDGQPDYHLTRAAPLTTAYGPELYRELFAAETP
jgi:MutS domain V